MNPLNGNHASTPNSQNTIFGNRLMSQSVPNRYHKVYIPKALCLISRYPFYDYFSEILEDLYRASRHHVFNVLESYINKLVLETPAPPRGLVQVRYNKFSKQHQTIELKQPPINKLPYVNNSFFNCLFKLIDLDDIVTIFTHLLVEKDVNK